jgi:predicted DNA-binding ribbon-helix-helix protein
VHVANPRISEHWSWHHGEGRSVLRRYPLGVKLIFHNSTSVPIQSGTQFYAASQFGRGNAVIVPVVIRGGETVKSSVLKRSIVIAGHKTSVSLEDKFWDSLKEIAGERNMTLQELVATIDADRQHTNLSSAIRLFVLGVYRDQVASRQDRTREALPNAVAR